MLWLTWRQHRWQLLGVAALVAGYVGYLIWAGVVLRQALATCPSSFRDALPPASCIAGMDVLNKVGNDVRQVMPFGYLLPMAVGMFWGAPLLARELEQGTYRLVFTQSVSRRRWLATKLGVLTGAAALLGAITGAAVYWVHVGIGGGFDDRPFGTTVLFSQAGPVPAATWVFALVVGVTLGVLCRRTMVAAAVTLVALPLVFAGLVFARPHYLPPVERVADSGRMISDPFRSNSPEGWVYQVSYLDATGRELSSSAAGEICADPANTYPTADCLDRTGLRQRIVYQPADRYRWFQLIEMGGLLSASAGLTLLVRRRISSPLP